MGCFWGKSVTVFLFLILGQRRGSSCSRTQTQKRADVPPDLPHIDQGETVLSYLQFVKVLISFSKSVFERKLEPETVNPLLQHRHCVM